MQFHEAALHGAWFSDPRSYDYLVFGDASLLLQAIREAAQRADFRPVIRGMDQLLQEPARFGAFLAEDAEYPSESGLAVLAGLRGAVEAAQVWIEHHDDIQSPASTRARLRLQDQLRAAVAGFGRAWGDSVRSAFDRDGPWNPVLDANPVWQLLTQLSRDNDRAGIWITWDVLQRLVPVSTGQAAGAGSVRSATTPVLVAPPWSRRGFVMWLTVELLPDCRGGFDPDPLSLGLTAVQDEPTAGAFNPPADQERVSGNQDRCDLLHIMRRVWAVSAVGDRFRGRWGITCQCPVADSPFSHLPPVFVRRLEGRSVEAAALAAIWAASGTVPYDTPFAAGRPLPLMLDVAVTACLDHSAAERPSDMALRPVKSIGPKLVGAREAGLDTVLLAEDEEPSAAEDQPRAADRPTAAGHQPSASVHVVRIKTIREALDRMLVTNRFLNKWQEQQQRIWRDQWESGTAELEPTAVQERMPRHLDKPPYIGDQGWRLLTDFQHPEDYLHAAYFRHRREASVEDDESPDDRWSDIDCRDDVVFNRLRLPPVGAVDLQLLCVTSDAGVGKSATVDWLLARFNRPDTGLIAFKFQIGALPVGGDATGDGLRDQMAAQLRDENEGQLSADLATEIIDFYRRSGRLVLLFDGLDQIGDRAQLDAIQSLLVSPLWEACRKVVAGRPHAVQREWQRLFAGRPWRFLQAEELTPAQQRRYLGNAPNGRSRYDRLPEEARGILSVPRVLYYLWQMSEDRFARVETASDVYYLAIEEMILRGMQGSPQARLIGWQRPDPPDKPQALSLRTTLELLGIIAFEMTSQTLLRPPAVVGDEVATVPNFDRIGRAQFSKFEKQLYQRCLQLRTLGDFGHNLRGLGALNTLLDRGLFDVDVDGLDQIQFRNRSLQEFLCAYYLAQHALPDDVARLWNWVYLPDQPATEEYYFVWQYLCEMHPGARDPDCWCRAIEPLYRPAFQSAQGTWEAKRSNEMIFRSWSRLQEYCAAGHALALQLRERWWNEFENLPARRPEARGFCQQIQDSLITLPVGDYEMGSPPDKPGMAREQDTFWRDWIAGAQAAPEAEIEKFLESHDWGVGRKARARREEWRAFLLRVVQGGGLELVRQWVASAHVPQQRQHTVQAFQLSRCPTLNVWYRLYDPGHGLRLSPFRKLYQQFSPDAQFPAIHVSWFDAWAFCLWLRWGGGSCRLPWEDEWEYAAKFGTPWDQKYWWGDEFDAARCNARESSVGRTEPPSETHANPATQTLDPAEIGLQDLLGNVWEWCQDQYREHYERTDSDAPGDTISSRVLRGGSFSDYAWHTCSATRDEDHPSIADRVNGMRIARDSDRP
ncbi:MAG: SUMF1/EgtB/PvdO family nonheme iron enzyme [Planctomycetota bacterium]|nr:SUMF1/EgtB/PvdO family nonheme iron enzyme [Planctomycetota bacterium]